MVINFRMSSSRMKKMTMQVKMVHKKKVMAMMTITMAMQVKMAFKKKVKAAISKSDLFPTVAWSATQPNHPRSTAEPINFNDVFFFIPIA